MINHNLMHKLVDRINALPHKVILSIWGGSLIFFALIYTTLSYFPGNGPVGINDASVVHRFFNSLYYSVITATNTGYGDIVPLGYSRIFAALQSIIELFLFALFVAKLVSNRQDKALHEIHELSFELLFRNIREDFYLARNDFDHVTEIIHQSGRVSDTEWERLVIGYQHITSLLQEIPDFYDITSDLYIIDPGREILLLEAVQRTMERLNNMLVIMREANIDYLSAGNHASALKQMLHKIDALMPLWRKHSHDRNHDGFDHIKQSLSNIHIALKKA